jgi:hypothetical protein
MRLAKLTTYMSWFEACYYLEKWATNSKKIQVDSCMKKVSHVIHCVTYSKYSKLVLSPNAWSQKGREGGA